MDLHANTYLHADTAVALAKSLQAKTLLTVNPVITIAPGGQPAENANATIGEISIVEH